MNLFRLLASVHTGKRNKIFLLASAALQAVLELAGLAIVLPLFLLLLLPEHGKTPSNPWLLKLYEASAVTNYGAFLLLSIGAILILLILKNVVLHRLNTYKTRLLLEIYGQHSRMLYFSYYSRGLSFIKQSSPGTLSHQVNGACYQFVFGVISPALTLVGDLTLILLIIAFLAWIHLPVAAVELILFVPLIFLCYRKTGELFQKAGKADHHAKRDQWSITMETFRGYADITVNNYFMKLSNAFTEGISTISKSKLQTERLKSLSSKSVEISVLFLITAVIAGFYFFPGGGPGLRAVPGIFAAATLRLLPAVRSAIAQLGLIRSNQHTLEIIKEAGSPSAQPDPSPALQFRHHIAIKNIRFGFNNQNPVFNHFSLLVRKGERLGIRGSSGAGKSTLLNLLMGLYRPEEGSVEIDGVPLSAVNRAAWHRLIGYVSQEVFILKGTIEENISPEPFPDPRQIDQAIRMAALREMTGRLACRAGTEVGEGGSRLSGGERQRIAIARALFKDAEVLLLDEPTSALDASTEEQIVRALTGLMDRKDLTIILISHREHLLNKCDRIIDLK